MKKFLILILVIFVVNMLLISETTHNTYNNKKFSIELGAGVRGIASERFSSVYSGTSICYSLDIAFKIMKSGEIFLHSDYLSIEGETSYTKEKTTFKMTPAELGFRLLLGKKSFVPYIGLGSGFYSYEDVHPGLTSLSESKMGFFGEGGLKFFVSQSLFLDLKVKYIMLKSEKDVDLGGLTYTGGIGFRF